MALGLVVFLWVMEEWVGSMKMEAGALTVVGGFGWIMGVDVLMMMNEQGCSIGVGEGEKTCFMMMREGWFLARDKGDVVTEARELKGDEKDANKMTRDDFGEGFQRIENGDEKD
ncbi:hypothetical protein V6N12_068148 [Hibiscus sabdariffa]|uniref:Uncharacterized protein n=1 Tax=Hibiscus sabdariffa TaxID=183260 RepID=A0ABR2FPI3_9ROSI